MSKGYLGNQRLVSVRDVVHFSKEEVAEFIKCTEDPIYFIKNYIKIVNVDRGLIPFEMWSFQEEMIKTFVDNRFSIAKMPRQVGKTTCMVAVILWYILFHENYKVAILANKAEQAREILGRLQLAYENLPNWMQQPILEWNKGSILLANGSEIIAASTSSSAARGRSLNLVYLDEFAFVPSNMQESFFSSVYPTISSGTTTKVIITSTPNGLNTFYKIWMDSVNKRNSYVNVSINWWDVPGRDDEWKRQTIENTSERQFRIEFCCEFLGSSNTLIDGKSLSQLVYIDPYKSTEDINIFEEPKEDHIYVCVVDTARGTGNDNSAFIIIDITSVPYKVVLTYRNNTVPVVVYPSIIHSVVKSYNDAYVLVESNDVGAQVCDILHSDLECENVIMTQTKGRGGTCVASEFSTATKFGIKTTKSVKSVGCTNLKNIVENQQIFLNDYNIISEISRFTLHGSSYQAEEGTDDLVMCLVLFSWFQADPFMKSITDMGIRKSLHEKNQEMLDENLVPFGVISTGHDELGEEVTNLPNDVSFEKWLML